MSKTLLDKKNPKVIIDKNMRDYSHEPAFVKAAERATAFLKKHGLPKEFIGKKEKSNK